MIEEYSDTIIIQCLDCKKPIQNIQNDDNYCKNCFLYKQEQNNKIIENLDREIKNYEKMTLQLDKDIAQIQKFNEQFTQQESLEQLQQQEQQLEEELASLQYQQESQNEELKQLEEQVRQIEKKEFDFWKEFNKFEQIHSSIDEQNSILNNQISYLSNQIKFLSQVSVLNDVFYIDINTNCGMLNGIKFGLKDQKIDWSDQNAGFGQVIMFLAVMQEKYDIQFKKIESLKCLGNVSEIQCKENQKYYYVYGEDNQQPQIEEIFNKGIELILSGIQDIFLFLKLKLELINKSHRDTEQIHQIHEKRLDEAYLDISSNFQMENWREWTKACKYLLTNIKQIIKLSDEYDKLIQDLE